MVQMKRIPTRMPPLHPHCRCRVVMEIEERQMPITVESPAWAPKGISQRELEDEFKALSPQEIANRIKAHQGSDWLRPASGGKGVNAYKKAKTDLNRHFLKHAEDMGYNSITDYKRNVYGIIKKPDEVYVERKKGKTFYHFIKDNNVVISDDDNLSIVSFYRLDKNRWRNFNRDGIIRIL